MRIYRINLKLRPVELFYKVPKTFSFFKDNQVIYRTLDVYHLIATDGYVYTFSGTRNVGMYSRSKIPFDDFDTCYFQSDYPKHYADFKNFVNNCTKPRAGLAFSRNSQKFALQAPIEIERTDFRGRLNFLMTYYYQDTKFYFEESLCLDKNSDNYARIVIQTKRRS